MNLCRLWKEKPSKSEWKMGKERRLHIIKAIMPVIFNLYNLASLGLHYQRWKFDLTLILLCLFCHHFHRHQATSIQFGRLSTYADQQCTQQQPQNEIIEFWIMTLYPKWICPCKQISPNDKSTGHLRVRSMNFHIRAVETWLLMFIITVLKGLLIYTLHAVYFLFTSECNSFWLLLLLFVLY